MKRILLVSLLLALHAGGAQAQLYKSVGPDGKVTYSDTPPASSVKLEVKSLGSGPSTQGLPFEVTEAMRTSPVVLFTSSGCSSCESARSLLNARGIPFSEKTVTSNEDIEAFKRAGGNKSLPYLTVGRSKQEGFEEGAWNRLLSSAGYPDTSKLPKTYRQPPAEPAAPPPKVVQEKERAGSASDPGPSGSLPEPIGNAPPGFRF